MPWDYDQNGKAVWRPFNQDELDQMNQDPTPAPTAAPPPQPQGPSFMDGVSNFLGGAVQDTSNLLNQWKQGMTGLFDPSSSPARAPAPNTVAGSVTGTPGLGLPSVNLQIPPNAGDPSIRADNPTLWQRVTNEANQLPNQLQEFGNYMGSNMANALGIDYAAKSLMSKSTGAEYGSIEDALTQKNFAMPKPQDAQYISSNTAQGAAGIGQFLGSAYPFLAGAGIAEGVGAAATSQAARLAPWLVNSTKLGQVAGNVVGGVAGQAALGATVGTAEQVLKGIADPNDFNNQGGLDHAISQINQDIGNFSLLGAISPTMGTVTRGAIARLLPAAIQNGGITGALRNALIAAGGGTITGATVAGVDTLVNYLKDPSKFNSQDELNNDIQNTLLFGGFDAVMSILHASAYKNDFTLPNDNITPPSTPPPTDFKPDQVYPNNATIDNNPYVFKSGTKDMATQGYDEVMPGTWVNPQNSGDIVKELVEHPNDPNWLVPKTLVRRNELAAQRSGNSNPLGTDNPSAQIDPNDPLLQARVETASQPAFGGVQLLPGEVEQPPVNPGEIAAMAGMTSQEQAIPQDTSINPVAPQVMPEADQGIQAPPVANVPAAPSVVPAAPSVVPAAPSVVPPVPTVPDDLLNKAIQHVANTQSASVNGLQGVLGVGAPVINRLVDEMQNRGIVGPSDGTNPRTINVQVDNQGNVVPKPTDNAPTIESNHPMVPMGGSVETPLGEQPTDQTPVVSPAGTNLSNNEPNLNPAMNPAMNPAASESNAGTTAAPASASASAAPASASAPAANSNVPSESPTQPQPNPGELAYNIKLGNSTQQTEQSVIGKHIAPGLAVRKGSQGWAIDHTPTGMNLAVAHTQARAIQAAKNLAAVHDWSTKDPVSSMSDAAKSYAMNVRAALNAKQPIPPVPQNLKINTTAKEGITNGTEQIRTPGETPNATEPTEHVPGSSAVGTTGSDVATTTGSDATAVRPNEATTAGSEPNPAERELPTTDQSPESNPQPGVGDGQPERDVSGRDNSSESGNESTAVSGQSTSGTGQRKPTVSRRDFVITNELDDLGGAKTKYKNNVAAIRALRQIESEDRLATPEEQSILAKYVGWGGVSDAFDERKVDSKEWGKEIAELKQMVSDGLISQDEYEAARKSTLNAHYTSPQVIKAIYNALDRMGFDTGRILEPSMGTGNFFGLMPENMANKAERTGVELDPLTGRIARQLYQKADVQIKGFEKFLIGDNHFDVAVGNVPFGDYAIVDPAYKGALDFVKQRIHNYFFIKSLDKVRPGGIVSFVTSAGTMNARDNAKIRELIGKKADFLGAIRLPGDAFKKNAGTEVTTDILFLQKRPEGQAVNHADNFIQVIPSDLLSKIDNKPMTNNEYFVKHPEMVLGKYYEDKLHPGRLGVESDGRDMEQALQEAVSRLPEKIYTGREMTPDGIHKEDTEDYLTGDVVNQYDEGAYAVRNGVIFKREGEKLVPAKVTGTTALKIKGLVGIREAARQVLDEQLKDASDADLKKSQDQLNKLYDAYVKKYGILNDPSNLKLFSDDPIGQSVLRSLENNVQTSKDGKKTNYTATKSDVFSQRTIQKNATVDKVDTSDEALVVSLFEKGKVDFNHMTALTGKDQETLVKELDGKVFQNPLGGFETVDEYLSGNVRQKLRDAEAAAAKDPKFKTNVDALQAIQPTDLTPSEIKLKLGATWIEPTDVQDFIHEFLGVNDRVVVRYQPILAKWSITEKGGNWHQSLSSNTKNTDEYGVKPKYGRNRTSVHLIEDGLNLRQPLITYKTDDDKTVTDIEATNEARNKLKQIQDIFQDWIWQDEARSARVAEKYNELFNSTRLRDFNASEIYNKQIPNMDPKWSAQLYDHQKNAVWRAVQGNNLLLAHEVGFGKTATMIMASQEMKRLGLVNKPMIVVPNYLLSQWEASFRSMYPNANILVLDSKGVPSVRPPRMPIKDSVTGQKRKQTDAEFQQKLNQNRSNRAAALGKIAFSNYDAIIMSHQTFGKLPMSPQSVQEHIREQLDELTEAIKAAAADEGKKGPTVKQLEDAKAGLQAKLETNLDEASKDVSIPFEQLGIDQIFVDEAHEFKNLKFHTKMTRVASLPQTSSKRAQDMYLKSQWLSKQRNEKGVVFATGTPISNSVAEMFTTLRYLQMQHMRDINLSHFDAWASTFGDTVTAFEQDATGKYKQKTRFARFNNVPELMTMFRDIADIKTADMIKIPRPDHVEHHLVTSQLSSAQKAYRQELLKRAQAIKSGSVTPEEDNFLKLTTDGRKMATDIRLVDPTAKSDSETKIDQLVKNVYSIWKDPEIAKDKEGNPVENHAQLVFLDLGTPKAKDTKDEPDTAALGDEPEDHQSIGLYDEIRSKLMQQGMPRNQIAFIHEANTDAKKQQLFNDVNAGNVRVLIGSTGKMGTGMNAQERLVALHHMDAPWKPSDIEQREGRIIRNGNKNNRVHLFNYITEGSFDSLMWDILKTKAKFIAQVMNGTADVRTMEDVEEMTLGFSHIAAVASGNPLILEKHKIDQKVLELQSLKTAYERNKNKGQSEIAQIPGSIKGAQARIEAYQKDIQTRKDVSGDNFTITLDNQTFTDRKEAGQKLIKLYEEKYDKLSYNQNEKVGQFAGFDLYIGKPENFYLQGAGGRYQAHVNVESPQGTTTRLENSISTIENKIERDQQYMQTNEKRLAELKELVARPFKEDQQLKEAVAEQSDLIKKLSELDGENNAVAGSAEEESSNDVMPYVRKANKGSSNQTGNQTGNPAANQASTGNSSVPQTGPLSPPHQQLLDDTMNHLTPRATKTIADAIAKGFDTVIRKGHVANVNEGEYRLKSNAGAIRNRSHYDWRVVGHELGHAFENNFKGFSGIKSELIDVANKLYPDTSKISAKNLPSEGFAEFFRVWVADPQQATKLAPYTTDAFEQFVNDDPKLKQLFTTVRTVVDNDLADTPVGRAMSSMAENRKPIDETYGDEYKMNWAKRFAFNVADFTIPMKDATNAAIKNGYHGLDLAQVAALTGSSQSKAFRTFTGKPRDAAGHFITNGRSLQGIAQSGIDKIGEKMNWSKNKVAGSSKEQGAIELFDAILRANRYVERYGRGFEKLPMPKEDAEWIVNWAQTEHPEAYQEAVEYARTLSKMGLDLLVDAGMITPDERQTVLAGSDYYIPTYYQSGKGFFSSGKSDNGKTYKNPLHRFKEGTGEVLDSFTSTILHLSSLHQAVEIKRVLETMNQLLDTKDMGKFGRFIPPESKVLKLGVPSMVDSINDFLNDPVSMDQVPNATMNIFIPAGLENFKNQPVVMNRRNGKPVFMELAPDLARSVMAMQPLQADAVLRIAGYVARFERFVGLLNPNYLLGVISRDFTQGIVQSKAPVHSFVKEWGKALLIATGDKMNIKTATEIMDAYIASGAHAGVARETLDNVMSGNFKTGLLQTKATGWMKPVKGTGLGFVRVMHSLPDAMRVLEEQPHLAEWMSVWKKQVGEMGYNASEMYNKYIEEGTDGLPQALQDRMEQILVKSAYASRENPLNIALHGAAPSVRRFTGVVPFLTGGVQGTYRSVRMMGNKEQRNNGILRMLIYLGGISLLSWGLMNKYMKEKYNDIPSEVRDKYWLFPMTEGHYMAVRKPIEPSLVINFLERFLDWSFHNSPEARGPLTDWQSGVKAAFDIHAPNIPLINTFVDLWANKDAFGNAIVPASESNLSNEQQVGPKTSQFGIKLAQLFADLTGSPTAGPSPRQTDYFMKQTFGTFGNVGLQVFNNMMGKPQQDGGVLGTLANEVTGALVKDNTSTGSRVEDRFYNDLKQATTFQQSADALMKSGTTQKPGWVTQQNVLTLKYLPALQSIDKNLATIRKQYNTAITAADPQQKKVLQAQLDYIAHVGTSLLYGVSPGTPLQISNIGPQQQQALQDYFVNGAQTSMNNAAKNQTGGADVAINYLMALMQNPQMAAQYGQQVTQPKPKKAPLIKK